MNKMFTKIDIEKYFVAEKRQHSFFFILGIVCLVIAAVFYIFIKAPFYQGSSCILLLFGVFLATGRKRVINNPDDYRKQNVYAYDMNPSELKEKELPRMEIQARNFRRYLCLKILMLIAGIILFVIFQSDPDRRFFKGYGVIFIIMSVILLITDYFAWKRRRSYTDGIRSFTQRL